MTVNGLPVSGKTVDVISVLSYNIIHILYGLLAQLGERLGHNQDVVSSSLAQTTNKPLKTAAFLMSFLHLMRMIGLYKLVMTLNRVTSKVFHSVLFRATVVFLTQQHRGDLPPGRTGQGGQCLTSGSLYDSRANSPANGFF